MTNKRCKLGKLYLRSWSTQLICVHTVIASHKIAIRQVEQLIDPAGSPASLGYPGASWSSPDSPDTHTADGLSSSTAELVG